MDYLKKIEQAFDEVCNHCTSGTGSMCDDTGCLAGFSQKCIEHLANGSGPRIKDGRSKLPITDLKMYEKEDAAVIIALVCKMCHNCEDNHSEDCVISLCRRAMEYAVTGEELVYKGSSLMYLKELENYDITLSQMVMNEFRQL